MPKRRRGVFVPLALGSRALGILGVLVERPGELVSRAEMISAVWPETVVEDSNLDVQIAALRRVLDEGQAERSCIATIRGRGYRFTAPVTRAADVVAAPTGTAPPLADNPSLAVMRFQNMSGDPEQEYFVAGVVEEIITALSRIRWLLVIARNSSFTYKGQAVDVKQVGRELGVRYVLEGAVRKAGGKLRIGAQLIDATIGAHLWADRFDGLLQDIFELQDQVAASVAGVIEPTLEVVETRRLPTGRPVILPRWIFIYVRCRIWMHLQRTACFGHSICSDKQSSVIPITARPSPWRRIATRGSRSIAGRKTMQRPGTPVSISRGGHSAAVLTIQTSSHLPAFCSLTGARTSTSHSH